tara:strand:- start:457 stop:1005 length:549 start_codon:yes stop_codon:yes gene_type:complete
MIFKSTNLTDIKKNRKNKMEAFEKFSIIGEQVIVNGQQPEKMRTMRATKILETNNFCSFVSGDADELSVATNLLQTLGVSIVSGEKDFSLKETQTDNETVDNPNIIDTKGLKNKKNKKIKTDNIFKNPDDPFYKLDAAPPRSVQLQNKKIKREESKTQQIKLGSDLSKMNIVSSKNSLKYFK